MIKKTKELINKLDMNTIVIMFFIFQPVMDMYMAFFKELVEIVGISINVFINLLLIGIMFVHFLVNCQSKKDIFPYLPYLVLCVIYTILHYINMTKFQDGIFNRETYGFFKETYYLFRLYFLPVLLMFLLYKMNIRKDILVNIVKYSVLGICLIIILSNIFCISLVSYSDEMANEFIKGNIFNWFGFKAGTDFDSYTSKGFFISANQVSAILLLLSPIVIKEAMTKHTWKEYGIVVVLVITMIMLGTKTSGFGILLAIVAVIGMMLFFKILKKYQGELLKPVLSMVVILLIGGILLGYSPMFRKTYGNIKAEPEDRPVEGDIQELIGKDDSLTITEFIKTHSWNYYIQEQLLEIYPIEKDLPFWIDKVTRDVRLNSNFRIIKTEIFERILERNNNPLDPVLGIGYSDELYNEKDYLYQYYEFGIAGVILFIGPFIAAFIYAGAMLLGKYKIYFTVENCTYAASLVIGLILPYITGHVFGVTFVMSYLSLVAALLLRSIKQTNQEKEIVVNKK